MTGTTIRWEGIPERYWPDKQKPWRVAWGIGCHQDFRTKREAQAFAARLRRDGVEMVDGAFNAAEVKV